MKHRSPPLRHPPPPFTSPSLTPNAPHVTSPPQSTPSPTPPHLNIFIYIVYHTIKSYIKP